MQRLQPEFGISPDNRNPTIPFLLADTTDPIVHDVLIWVFVLASAIECV